MARGRGVGSAARRHDVGISHVDRAAGVELDGRRAADPAARAPAASSSRSTVRLDFRKRTCSFDRDAASGSKFDLRRAAVVVEAVSAVRLDLCIPDQNVAATGGLHRDGRRAARAAYAIFDLVVAAIGPDALSPVDPDTAGAGGEPDGSRLANAAVRLDEIVYIQRVRRGQFYGRLTQHALCRHLLVESQTTGRGRNPSQSVAFAAIDPDAGTARGERSDCQRLRVPEPESAAFFEEVTRPACQRGNGVWSKVHVYISENAFGPQGVRGYRRSHCLIDRAAGHQHHVAARADGRVEIDDPIVVDRRIYRIGFIPAGEHVDLAAAVVPDSPVDVYIVFRDQLQLVRTVEYR